MPLDDFLKLKAITLREQLVNPRLVDEAIRQTPDKVRNLQAAVSVELFDAVEDVCQKLDMSKREFIEAAVVDAVNKAESAIEGALADLPRGRK